MEQNNREHIIKMEAKMENIEANISNIDGKVDNLTANVNNLVVALTKNSQQSETSKSQITELYHKVDTLFKKNAETDTRLWRMAIAITVVSSGTGIGIGEILKSLGI